VFRSAKDLETAIRDYIEIHNEDSTPFVWTRTADQILASIARYNVPSPHTPPDVSHEPLGQETRTP